MMPSLTPTNVSSNSFHGTFFDFFSFLSVIYTISTHTFIRLLAASPPVRKIEIIGGGDRRRLAIVTGSNTGIGFEAARKLVLLHDTDVLLACRSRDKALSAVQKINAEVQSRNCVGKGNKEELSVAKAHFLHPLDLSSFQSVREFSQVFHENYDQLDILVNNAGLNTSGRSQDDLDLLFQTNFLGHFLLTKLLLDRFPPKGGGRIVNLSSVMHHFLDNPALDEKYWKTIAVDGGGEAYSASKLAAILLTLELNRQYGPASKSGGVQIQSMAVNPGAVLSDIWRSFPRFVIPIFSLFYLNTSQGCETTVAAAVGNFQNKEIYLQPYWMPQNVKQNPPFPVFEMLGPFVGYEVTQPRLPSDGGYAAARALWKVSEDLCGCKSD